MQAWEYRFQVFPGTANTPREVNDECLPPDSGHCPGEHCMGGFEQTCGSHGLGHTWHLAINNRKSCIRRYILWADPGAAGRNHQIQAKFVGKVAKSLFNEVLLIRKHLLMSYEESSFVQKFLHGWTASILAFTPETPIADCQYCRPFHI
jgi:hypothetical protein